MIGVRYRLIPYLYSEYMKAALNDDMMFRPLTFDYTEDSFASQAEVALNEVPLFIRKGKAIPVADAAETVKDIDVSTIRMIGYENADYDRYDDDGISTL